MRILRALLSIVVLIGVAILALRLFFPVPPLEGRPESMAIAASPETTLGAAILPLAEERPGESGVWPLADGREAYAARILLARAAEVSIDVQYYIWQTDTTGWILLDELRQAADRGVRVRLLLDDNGIPGLDAELAALHAHENVEVRLWNPFTLRNPKLLSYAFDFPRLNRRMHNKSMTVDGVVTVVGGRNIGDIYFAFGQGVHYFDADVLAIGPVAAEVATDFDLYWEADSAYPADMILPEAPEGLSRLETQAVNARETALGSGYAEAAAGTSLVQDLEAGTLALDWGEVLLFSDDPAKGLGLAEREDLLIGRITSVAPAESSFDLVSAYFIPGREGADLLTGMAERGVRTRVMTNSLSATDVPPVHGAYMNYREELLDAGVTLLELERSAGARQDRDLSSMIVGSASSLHAKTFQIDGERLFVGSFNFDPRSAHLNTEMGLLVPSGRMATGLAQALDRPQPYYRLEQGEGGELRWIETADDGTEIVHLEEPETGVMIRTMARIVSWLPVEWML
ncbi:phospholipase D family protein [Histidinibacterium lentulum]|uniref:Phospholipase D n=1 Tax=Histidinibacterium lentulum TaxID=2480588 RepID=A0A3N2R6V4_9RHOB|nr:phospholipase D family protein [Histidinibacterium lentulum]ROU03209.1 phospholipase D family protein [Histidinibacterium lentulum]